MRKTRSQLRAAQIAKLQAEQVEHENRIESAIKVAKYARCAVVEELYELLDVRAEQKARESRNGVIQVSTDKDESKRTARLLDAVTQLIAMNEGAPGADTVLARGAVAPLKHSVLEPEHALRSIS